MNDSDVLLSIKKGNTKVLKDFYIENRTFFIEFGKRYCNSKEDILDVYQDAIITFQEQVIDGKADNLKSSLKTYLFGIGKYMLFEKNRKQKKELSVYKNHNDDIPMISIAEEDTIIEMQQAKIQQGLRQLGKKCREVIMLFYYNNLTIEEIQEYLNYQSKDVVKSQKSRCLKQLKSKING